jgi:hypothetical protein
MRSAGWEVTRLRKTVSRLFAAISLLFGTGDPRRYTTVECFASATWETVKDTAHAHAIVAEMSDALSKMSKLGTCK